MPTQSQINSMTFEQLQQLGFPVATDAQYETGLHVPGYDGSTAGSGYDPKAGTAIQSFLGGIPNFINHESAISAAKGIYSGGKAAGAAFDFITDIPRVATTIVGGLLLAAAIFSIAGGSHRDIINVVKGP